MTIRFLPHLFTAILAATVLIALGNSAGAQSPDQYYEDKTVTFVVGFGPGGGYDTYTRLLAPYVGERLGATVVVKNQPGGRGMVALNQLVSGKPDGLTIMFAPGHFAAFAQLVGQEGARFDLAKLPWLARAVRANEIVFVSAKSPYRTIEDLANAKEPIKFSASQPAIILCRALHLNCKQIRGYRGSKQFVLAAIRGEIDAFTLAGSSARKAAEGGQIIPVFALGHQRSQYFKDTPTIFERGNLTAEQKWWFGLEDDVRNLGRAFVTTPGVAADRVAYLRRVFSQVLNDPDVIAAADKIKRPLSYLSGEEVEKTVGKVLSMDAERRRQVRDLLLSGRK